MTRNARNIKEVVCFGLGGHVATQNKSFSTTVNILEPKGYRFYGAEDGFSAFRTGIVYPIKKGLLSENFAGFYSGAGRDSLLNKDGSVNQKKLEIAIDFFKKGKYDIAIASAGEDHGMQMEILRQNLEGIVEVYVINKTMDNDLGGTLPYTDFTNGFHSAVSVGIQEMKNHFTGAWTNNLAYLISPFGREANWVGLTMAYFGFADRFIYGELPEGHPGHSIERVHDLIVESQNKNEKKYGRRFAMIVVAEGTRIRGIEHASKEFVDPHGHHKLNPEGLVIEMKKELEARYRMKTQTLGITYEMRNSPATKEDLEFAKNSGLIIANAILNGNSGVESVFKIEDGEIKTDVASIAKVSEKRFALYYPKPLIDYHNFKVNDEIGKYYRVLFGEKGSLKEWLPKKPKKIHIF